MEKDKVESRTELPIKRFLRPEQRVKWEKWLNDAGWEESDTYPAADKNQRVILMLLAELISAEEELTKALASRPSVPQQGQALDVDKLAEDICKRLDDLFNLGLTTDEGCTGQSYPAVAEVITSALAASRSEEATAQQCCLAPLPCLSHPAGAAGSTERWIPVSEKLPHFGENVVVVINGIVQTKTATWRSYKRWDFGEDYDDAPAGAVTHWRLLPTFDALAGTDTDVAKGE